MQSETQMKGLYAVAALIVLAVLLYPLFSFQISEWMIVDYWSHQTAIFTVDAAGKTVNFDRKNYTVPTRMDRVSAVPFHD